MFISCADELEENCCSLNDEIAKDKDIYRDTTGYRLENAYEIYFGKRYKSLRYVEFNSLFALV